MNGIFLELWKTLSVSHLNAALLLAIMWVAYRGFQKIVARLDKQQEAMVELSLNIRLVQQSSIAHQAEDNRRFDEINRQLGEIRRTA